MEGKINCSRPALHMLQDQVMNFLDFHLSNHGFEHVMPLFSTYPTEHYKYDDDALSRSPTEFILSSDQLLPRSYESDLMSIDECCDLHQ